VDRDRPAGTSSESVLAGEIRRRRVAAGWSQAELAVRVGYSREYVSRAERPGRGLISANLVRALDAALDTGGALAALREQAHQDRLRRRAGSAAGPALVVSAADGERR
jgi:transcriptional regulator with XRE-family HTH domain